VRLVIGKFLCVVQLSCFQGRAKLTAISLSKIGGAVRWGIGWIDTAVVLTQTNISGSRCSWRSCRWFKMSNIKWQMKRGRRKPF